MARNPTDGETTPQNVLATPDGGIWVVDLATHKVVLRHPVPGKVSNIQVSQDPKPLVYVNGDEGAMWVLEGDTLETKHDVKRAGGGALFVAAQ